MSYSHQDFLKAELVVDSLAQNLAIHFQCEGLNFSKETMQRHVNDRSALIRTKMLLLDEAERLLNNEQPPA